MFSLFSSNNSFKDVHTVYLEAIPIDISKEDDIYTCYIKIKQKLVEVFNNDGIVYIINSPMDRKYRILYNTNDRNLDQRIGEFGYSDELNNYIERTKWHNGITNLSILYFDCICPNEGTSFLDNAFHVLNKQINKVRRDITIKFHFNRERETWFIEILFDATKK